MKYIFIKILIAITLIPMLLLTSCEKEEVEIITETPELIVVDTVVSCSGELVIDSSGIVFADYGESSAALFTGNYNTFPWWPENAWYLVVYSNEMNWSTGPKIGYSANGMKGFEVISENEFQKDSSYLLFFGDGSIIVLPEDTTGIPGGYLLDAEVTFNTIGLEVGDFLGGTITATFYDWRTDIGSPIVGNFCVEITEKFD